MIAPELQNTQVQSIYAAEAPGHEAKVKAKILSDTPTAHQLYEMISDVKDVMQGLANMQATIMKHQQNQQQMMMVHSDKSGIQVIPSTMNTDNTVLSGLKTMQNAVNAGIKEVKNKTSTNAGVNKGSTTPEEPVAIEGKSTDPLNGTPKKKKNSALQKNLNMLMLKAKLKNKGKMAKKRLKTKERLKSSKHLTLAVSNFRRKVDKIDLKIMQGDVGSSGVVKSDRSRPQQPKRQKTTRLSASTLGIIGGELKKEKGRSSGKKRNGSIYDLASSPELHIATPKKSFCEKTVIHPFNPWHTAWDCMVCLVLMILLWYMPLTLAFDEVSKNTISLSVTIDIIFGIDMIKQFRTGYITIVDEIVIMDSWEIAKKYLKSWFMADFVSCIPIDTIVMGIMTSISNNGSDVVGTGVESALRGTKSLKMLRLIRIAKLVRLMRVSRAFRYIRFAKSILEDKLKIEIPSSTIKLSRLLTLVILVCHWGACIHYFVCKMYNYPPESWIALANIQNLPLYQKYSWCFLKAGGSFVGVGFGKNPVSSTSCDSTSNWCEVESWLTFMQLSVGRIYYAILVAEVSSIIAHMDIARSAFEETMNATNVYMRAKKLPPEYVYFVISILLESKNIQLTNIHIYRIPFSRIPLFQ
jgi:hypothetical protein